MPDGRAANLLELDLWGLLNVAPRAALDLAEQGFKVYLVEQKSAIGGHMAQLDKTFPTNDCAMCTISPKLVETGRHPNIEILTDTEVLDVTGQAGNFTVNVERKPRYIDINKCIACGDCVKVCPVRACVPDPDHKENKEELQVKYERLQALKAA